MIPRNERALSEGVYIQAEAKPLGSHGMPVTLDNFTIEYEAEFPFA